MADPVENDLGDGALAFEGFGARLVIDRGGKALKRRRDVAVAPLADDEGLRGLARSDRFGGRKRHGSGSGPAEGDRARGRHPVPGGHGRNARRPEQQHGQAQHRLVQHRKAPRFNKKGRFTARVLEDG
jgi:hypothetical protein